MLTMPAGSAPKASASIMLVSGFCCGGLQTSALPAAIAGAIADGIINSGKVNVRVGGSARGDDSGGRLIGWAARGASREHGNDRIDAIDGLAQRLPAFARQENRELS